MFPYAFVFSHNVVHIPGHVLRHKIRLGRQVRWTGTVLNDYILDWHARFPFVKAASTCVNFYDPIGHSANVMH